MLSKTNAPGIYRYCSKQPSYTDQELVYKGRLKAAFKTAKTELVLLETINFGEVLFMNGEVQSSSSDERIYHESLILPAILAGDGAGTKHDVLLLGGGEGCAARDLFRWGAGRVVQYDYDEEAVRWAKTALVHWNERAYDDPRLTVVYADAREALQRGSQYDSVIVDLFDPTSADITGFVEILLGAARCLRVGGTIAAYIGDAPTGNDDVQVEIVRRLCAALPAEAFIHPYRVCIPSFAGEACFVLIVPCGDAPPILEKFPDWNCGTVAAAPVTAVTDPAPVYMDTVNWLRASSWTTGSPVFFKELSGKYALSCALLAASNADKDESR